MDGLNGCNCDAYKKKVYVELLYNSVKTGSQLVWRPRQLERRCWIEEHVPERLGPQAPGWAAQENGKETLMAIRLGVNMLQFFSVSNSLSHTTLSNKVRGIYFLKDCAARRYYCVVMFMHASAYEYTTQPIVSKYSRKQDFVSLKRTVFFGILSKFM